MGKLHELYFELHPQPAYSSDLGYFEAKNKSFYTKVNEWLEKRWNQCITQEGDYVDK